MIKNSAKILLLSLTLFSCGGDYEVHGGDESEKAMMFEFGKYDPKSVKAIKVKQLSRGESFQAWYKFECSEKVFKDLLGTGFDMVKYENISSHTLGANRPEFWDLQESLELSCLINSNWKSKFSRSIAIAVYDHKNMCGYFLHEGDI